MLRAHLGRITMAAAGLSIGVGLRFGAGFPTYAAGVLAAALAVLLAAAVRWGPRRHIGPAVLLAGAAMAAGLWSVASGLATTPRLLAALIWTAPAGAALVIGGYPRFTAHQRAVAVEQVRQAQRLQWARDLHDFVTHDISGIVAQAQAARFVAASRPDAAGPALTRRLTADGLRVVVVTTFDQDEYVHGALRNGACGFLLKRPGRGGRGRSSRPARPRPIWPMSRPGSACRTGSRSPPGPGARAWPDRA
jgi:hypothetical protein